MNTQPHKSMDDQSSAYHHVTDGLGTFGLSKDTSNMVCDTLWVRGFHFVVMYIAFLESTLL